MTLVMACGVMSLAVTERMRIDQVAYGERTKLILKAQLRHWPVESRPSYESALAERQQEIRDSFSYLPFVAIAAPLALLSAYLILWKPRKRKAESDA